MCGVLWGIMGYCLVFEPYSSVKKCEQGRRKKESQGGNYPNKAMEEQVKKKDKLKNI